MLPFVVWLHLPYGSEHKPRFPTEKTRNALQIMCKKTRGNRTANLVDENVFKFNHLKVIVYIFWRLNKALFRHGDEALLRSKEQCFPSGPELSRENSSKLLTK